MENLCTVSDFGDKPAALLGGLSLQLTADTVNSQSLNWFAVSNHLQYNLRLGQCVGCTQPSIEESVCLS